MTVWKVSSASSRPWEISGWYGVYEVYQRRLEDVATQDGGSDGVVIAESDHLHPRPVLAGDRPQVGQHILFRAGGRQVQRLRGPDLRRNGTRDEGVEGVVSEDLEQLRDLGLGRADVPVLESGCDVGMGHEGPPMVGSARLDVERRARPSPICPVT